MRPSCPKCGKQMMRGATAQSGKLRWQCREGSGERKMCYQTTDPSKPVRAASGATKKPQKAVIFRRTVGGKTTILVTAAQNATPISVNFVKALEAHANAVNAADILVIPYRYKNPTSRFGNKEENDEWWDERITPYLCNQRKRLNSNLILMGDIKIQATSRQAAGDDGCAESRGILAVRAPEAATENRADASARDAEDYDHDGHMHAREL